MKDLKKVLSLIMSFLIIFIVVGCNSKEEYKSNSKLQVRNNIQLNIVTTDKFLYNMVKSIVGNRHVVEYMFNDRKSEMNFKFTEDSVNNVSKKDLFFYVGADYEPWVDTFVDKLNKSKVGVINVSRGINLLSYNRVIKYNNTILKDNPYYVNNIDNYRIALMNIKNALEDRDAKSRDFYEKNFSETLNKLDSYKKDLKSVDGELSNYTFIVIEDELIYFAKYNNLKLLDVSPREDNSIMPLDSAGQKDLEQKLKDNKVVLLYNNDAVVKSNEELIKIYNIKTSKIEIYNGDFNYEETLKHNINSLENIYKK
ncbi:metal ABC transporter substrate-binding protein [Clostridium autoethanogenum]|uniref:Zinc ABC transporter substrate-binding protein n=1 Tax=Clostridium autoethanogenum DSM 10061 TaxID=1341692 RepID=A0ABM5NU90_9CLOT|nr:zinc ABC transporter substrate-binding protein [Clostridium autoethanogenum]AGY75893.2 zinc ABC transporter substrate-binding protein [Clostridium autoethanogenum DSM 10061]